MCCQTQSPNGNRISKLITAVYKVNRQDKTRQHTTEAPGENPGSGVTRLSGIYLGAVTNPGSSGSGEKR